MMKMPVLIAAVVLGPSVAACVAASSVTVPFKEATLIVETNATDGDAGLQVFLDHEPWKSISITRPDGTKVIDVATAGVLADYGLTELFSESSEPPFTEFPLEEFVQLFPEGEYTFAGETIDGTRMESRVTLSHNFPAGPEILAPEEDSSVPAGAVVIRWGSGEQPGGIEIVGYRVLVTNEDPLRVFSADLPSTAAELTVPIEFIEPGVEYKIEVMAIEASGNQTLTEITFTAE